MSDPYGSERFTLQSLGAQFLLSISGQMDLLRNKNQEIIGFDTTPHLYKAGAIANRITFGIYQYM